MQIVLLYVLFLFCLQLKYSPFVLFLVTIVTKQKIFLEFGEFTLEYNGQKMSATLYAAFKYSAKRQFSPVAS
ncbi:MAG: hypothetical protein CM15mP100_4670 [Alphaproteobacteria bacterium]|nr:MAG: hypothetical protein CM15mP100_4670 [Alphaproteobacteria bacterium]